MKSSKKRSRAVVTVVACILAVCLVAALLVGGLIVFQHRSNIQRLIQGNENKFSLHKKAK